MAVVFPKCHAAAMEIHFTETESPLGQITLAGTDRGLAGLYFAGQKHWPAESELWGRDDGPRFDAARRWLAEYFAGGGAGEIPALDLIIGTSFQRLVWNELRSIAFAETASYGEIARRIGRPSAVRAVGAAIGRNPLSILIPCHRVVGSSGGLTGYAGGLDRKRHLLEHERAVAVRAVAA